MGAALRCLEVHWAIIVIGCTVYLEPASKNCAEGFALYCYSLLVCGVPVHQVALPDMLSYKA